MKSGSQSWSDHIEPCEDAGGNEYRSIYIQSKIFLVFVEMSDETKI